MNLQEYINDKNPKHFSRVFLAPNEVELFHLWTDVMGVKYYHATIPLIAEKYNIEGSYIMRSNDLRLFTIDSDGNPQKASVFLLSVETYQKLIESNLAVG